MARLHRVLFVALAAIMVAASPIPGTADARTEEIAGLRADQARIAEGIESVREIRSYHQDLLDERRVHVVDGMPDGIEPSSYLVTLRDALGFWTREYLDALGDRPFRAIDLEAFIRDRQDRATKMEAFISDVISRLSEKEAALVDDWREMEAKIAGLMQARASGSGTTDTLPGQPVPTDGRTCAVQVGATNSDTVLSAKASADPRARIHGVADEGSKNGHPLRINLSWTAPPLQLCEGDQVYVEMIASNLTPAESHLGLNYVASIELTGSSGVIETVSCSNPANWVDVDAEMTPVGPQMTEWINGCTYRVVQLPDGEGPGVVFVASFGAMSGAGSVSYLYAVE